LADELFGWWLGRRNIECNKYRNDFGRYFIEWI
jgi:hypothetical protein